MAAGLLAGTVRSGLASHLSLHRALSDHRLWAVADLDERSAVMGSGDFNHDGIADLVKTAGVPGRHVLTLLLGRGDGTFARASFRPAIGSDPSALIVGDFNGDGNPDVIVGDSDGALLEFLGDGRGDLAPARTIATLGSVASIARGRFTKSGHLDMVVSDSHSNAGVVLLGAGDGTFHSAWSFPLPKIGVRFHIATADFNGDRIPDVAISNDDDDDFEVMLGNGNGTFTFSPKYSQIRDPNSYCPS